MPDCPLCGWGESSPSWLPGTEYAGRRFQYLECRQCGSSFCDPMPGPDTLARMYGSSYAIDAQDNYEVSDERQHDRTLALLATRDRGVFLDFGCGKGELLADAVARGWEAIGVEFDGDIVDELRARLGVRVLTYAEAIREQPQADVVHAGDVLEHLTDVASQLKGVVRLMKPGGIFVAEGPLEANTNFFAAVHRWWARRRPDRVSDLPPWHVLLATADGQQMLFERVGLRTVSFEISEVDWPAPSSMPWRDWRRPRLVVLYAVRRISKLMSRARPGRWGNRYYYVGVLRERGTCGRTGD